MNETESWCYGRKDERRKSWKPVEEEEEEEGDEDDFFFLILDIK